ncbi:hypothetical protein PaG_02193 [Moesziomyces aphidis]|uniref:Uncharacterized protein n=1 Tax=Moesziomyces aphidis TaxID=84754 RepID=W3VSU8_MOEAP|nr:hypothetical protein PaG_02193 [Moesziomyces aphidis]
MSLAALHVLATCATHSCLRLWGTSFFSPTPFAAFLDGGTSARSPLDLAEAVGFDRAVSKQSAKTSRFDQSAYRSFGPAASKARKLAGLWSG